jgi:hypothetical protein
MGRILRRTALAGIAALAMGLIAAPGAGAQAAVTCLDLATFEEVPATTWAPTAPISCGGPRAGT